MSKYGGLLSDFDQRFFNFNFFYSQFFGFGGFLEFLYVFEKVLYFDTRAGLIMRKFRRSFYERLYDRLFYEPNENLNRSLGIGFDMKN